MKMQNLGVMPKKHGDCMAHSVPSCGCGEDEKKPHYPNLRLSSESLPEIEGYDVGDVVTLTFKAKVTGKHKGGFYTDGDSTELELDLLSGGCAPSSTPEEAETEDYTDEDSEIEDMKKVKTKKLDFMDGDMSDDE